MKEYKLSLKKLCNYMIIFLIILNSGFALATGSNKVLFVSQILLLLLLAISNIRFLRPIKISENTLCLALMLVLMLISFVINLDYTASMTYIQSALYIMIAYMVNKIYDSVTIINVFVRIMFVVAIISTLFAVLNLIIPFSSYSFIAENASGVKYYTLGIVNYIESTYAILPRNCGIFWEPGLYAGFLALAAMLDMRNSENKSLKYRILLFCIAIFFTYSTAGYIYIIMLVLMFFMKKKRSLATMMWIVGLFGIMMILVYLNSEEILMYLSEINPDVFEKIIQKNDSYLTRIAPPLADLKLIVQNPAGVGYGKLQMMRTQVLNSMGINIKLSTSTLTYHGAACGIVFFLTYNYLWVKNFFSMNKSLVFKLLSCLLFGMVLSSNPMYNNQFIWIFLFCSLGFTA